MQLLCGILWRKRNVRFCFRFGHTPQLLVCCACSKVLTLLQTPSNLGVLLQAETLCHSVPVHLRRPASPIGHSFAVFSGERVAESMSDITQPFRPSR